MDPLQSHCTCTCSSVLLLVADRNVSVVMDLELMATENLKRIAARHNFTFITTTLRGIQLGLSGEGSQACLFVVGILCVTAVLADTL